MDNAGTVILEAWKSVWKWSGPNRIRHFLWLTIQNKLLTNDERRRRHLTEDGSCRRCGNQCEDVNHIMRECPAAVAF
ncbi:Putative ribonuclease H protein At1g65750 [Linum perenne]